MPPEELTSEIQEVRVDFAEKYGFVKGLKPPVHISLTDILKIPVEDISEFEQQITKLQDWADCVTSFPIELKNFNFFDNKDHPVLYIDVNKTTSLATLQKELLAELRRFPLVNTKATSFTPHLTIGYRDIPPAAFPEIKEVYSRKRFQGEFECNAIYLWKHEFGKWEVVKQFDLKGWKPKAEQLELF